MLDQQTEWEVSKMYLKKVRDPREIAKTLPGVSILDVAYYLDLTFYDLAGSWHDDEPAEIYSAATFPELVDVVPGLLDRTREEIKLYFHKLYGCRLFEQLLTEGHEQESSTVLSSRPATDLDPSRDVHYLYVTLDKAKAFVARCSKRSQEEPKWYPFYMGHNYYVVAAPEILGNRRDAMEGFVRLYFQYVRRQGEFVQTHTPEETPVVEELRDVMLDILFDDMPAVCRFCELPFIRCLYEETIERDGLAPDEADSLNLYLREKDISLLTPMRLALYQKVSGQKRKPLSQYFFTARDE